MEDTKEVKLGKPLKVCETRWLEKLQYLSKFFKDNGQSFEGEISRFIAKSFLHELKNGCLTITHESCNLYRFATVCCTNMCDIINWLSSYSAYSYAYTIMLHYLMFEYLTTFSDFQYTICYTL